MLCELLGLLSAWRLLVAVAEESLLLLPSRKGWLSSVQALPSFIIFLQFYPRYLNSVLLIIFISSSVVSKTYINLYHLSTSFIKPFNLCKAFLPGHQRDCVLAADRTAFLQQPAMSSATQSHTASPQPHHPQINGDTAAGDREKKRE